MKRTRLILILVAGILCVGTPCETSAQGFLKKLKEKTEKVKKGVEKVAKQAEKVVDATNKNGRTPDNDNTSDSSENEFNQNETPLTTLTDAVTQIIGPEFDCSIGLYEKGYVNDNVKGGVAVDQMSERYDGFKWFDFNDDVAPVMDGNNFYFITIDGEKILENIHCGSKYLSPEGWPKFDKGRTIIIDKRGNGLIIDKEGKTIKDLGPVKSVYGFEDGIGAVVKQVDNRTHRFYYINLDGTEIYPNAIISQLPTTIEAYSMFHTPSDGLLAYAINDPKLGRLSWGYLNAENGTVAIKPNYRKVHDFHNGVALVQENKPGLLEDGKWFYIDKAGNKKFSKEFREEQVDFFTDYVTVKNDDYTCSVLCKDGTVLSDSSDSRISPFSADNTALVKYRKSDGGYAISVFKVTEEEKDGETVRKLVKVTDVNGDIMPDYCIQSKDGTIYYSSSGRLIPLDMAKGTDHFITARPFNGDYAATKWGWVDRKGNYIIRMIQRK